MNISLIGLGKLGLPLACCLAYKNKVLGIDKNEHILSKLRAKELPFYETGLSDIFPSENLYDFTDSYKRAIDETDATIILVNTQLGNYGYSSELVENSIKDLALNLKNSQKEYHLIIISSTVLPGTLRKLIKIVEKGSGRKFGIGFGLTHVPDFVRLGNVIEDFKNPEFFLVGGHNEKDILLTLAIWDFHENCPIVKILTLEEAEIAKITLNAYIVNKISFANFVGLLCDGIENVDVNNITDTIGIDKRISPYFFKSGAPYGGTCFPRDATAFIKFAKDRKFEAKNLKFAEEVNEMVYENILNDALKYDYIGIFGISFKPDSPVTVASPGYRLLLDLVTEDKTVYCHDFCIENADIGIWGKSISEIINNSQCIYILHPDKRYKNYKYKNVFDIWGIL